jgi:hypothetical protein
VSGTGGERAESDIDSTIVELRTGTDTGTGTKATRNAQDEIHSEPRAER